VRHCSHIRSIAFAIILVVLTFNYTTHSLTYHFYTSLPFLSVTTHESKVMKPSHRPPISLSDGAETVFRDYRFELTFPLPVRAEGSQPDHRHSLSDVASLRFIHYKPGRCYRAIASRSEMENPHGDYRQRLWDILSEWALLDTDGPQGPVLGESARVDGLQGCNLEDDDHDLTRGAARDDLAQIAAEKDRALIL